MSCPCLTGRRLLAIVLPTAFFAALDRGYDTDPAPASAHAPFSPLVSDRVRDDLLKMSRGMSVMLLLVYIASRLYRHLPPRLSSRPQQSTPTTAKSETASATVDRLRMAPLADERDQHPPASGRGQDGPQKGEGSRPLHQVACMLLIVVSIAVMAVTAEFLVESIDPFRERTGIEAEWFGLILLPLVSFAPEAVVATVRFVQPAGIWFARLCRSAIRGANDDLSLAHGRPIDLSIQFTLWWMPLLVLFGWWTGKPVHLLFDYFEVALLLGSCFLVNYVTSDGKTNFVEGFTLILFYGMVALAAWFYPGQPQVALMLNCPGSVAEVVAQSGIPMNAIL
ncbi:hypothetical protein BD413DRAFT_468225 [Trametes elegans]|nr:hypothetical protein BD413DRAFT_468225 [Trametes elegans]